MPDIFHLGWHLDNVLKMCYSTSSEVYVSKQDEQFDVLHIGDNLWIVFGIVRWSAIVEVAV